MKFEMYTSLNKWECLWIETDSLEELLTEVREVMEERANLKIYVDDTLVVARTYSENYPTFEAIKKRLEKP
jgi:hypothetical protein